MGWVRTSENLNWCRPKEICEPHVLATYVILFISYFKMFILFISYFNLFNGLCWVFIAVHGLPLDEVGGDYSLVVELQL